MRTAPKPKEPTLQPPKPNRFEFVGHTADIAMRAFGGTVEEIFINAAAGMFFLIAEKSPAATDARRWECTIASVAANREELLVSWLNDLLSYADIHRCIIVDAVVTQFDAQHIRATVIAEDCGAQYTRKTEIKAATYHDLCFEQTADGYCAYVLFDI